MPPKKKLVVDGVPLFPTGSVFEEELPKSYPGDWVVGDVSNGWELTQWLPEGTWLLKCIQCGTQHSCARHDYVQRIRPCKCFEHEKIKGQKYGMLTAIQKTINPKHRNNSWDFKCDCGRDTSIALAIVLNGKQTSCGCLKGAKTRAALFKDRTGQQIGDWTVLYATAKTKGKVNPRLFTFWVCRCVCGAVKEVDVGNLGNGGSTGCGCRQRENARKGTDFTGQRFDRLLVLERVENKGGQRRWLCECDCGNFTVAQQVGLRNGSSRSCGCIAREGRRARRGPLSPLWRHDLTEEERTTRRNRMNNPEIRAWRKAVYLKDHGECQICGDNRSVEAHHINSFQDNPVLRTDVNNGILMCEDHHIQFHRHLGGTRVPCTQADLDNYRAVLKESGMKFLFPVEEEPTTVVTSSAVLVPSKVPAARQF